MPEIIVGLDGSPREPAVLRAALRLTRLGDQLVLLRAVTRPVELPPHLLTVRPDEVVATLEREARAALAARAAELPPEVVAKLRVEVGVPWHVICDAARDEGAALVVIGSHGYGGVDRLLGTTAAKVVDHAKQSVLVVRE